MAEITNVHGEETRVETDRWKIMAAIDDGDFDTPVGMGERMAEEYAPEDEAEKLAEKMAKASLNRVWIADPSEAPEGAEIVEGPDGGTYYIPEDANPAEPDPEADTSGGDDGESGEDAPEAPESVDIDPEDLTTGMEVTYQTETMDEPETSQIVEIHDSGSVEFENGTHIASWAVEDSIMNVEAGESGLPDDDSAASEGESGGEVDLPTFDPSEAEYEDLPPGEGGVSEGAMRVATMGDSTFYVTDYGAGLPGTGFEDDPEEGERAMVGYHTAKMFGLDVPEHQYEPDEWMAVEGVDGTTAWSFTDYDKVDEDEYVEKAAAQLIAGNIDMHGENVLVGDDGTIHMIDLDHAGGQLDSPAPGNSDPDGTFKRALKNLGNTGGSLNIEDAHQKVYDKAVEMAEEIAPEDVNAAIDEMENYNAGFAQNVDINILTLIGEELDPSEVPQ